MVTWGQDVQHANNVITKFRNGNIQLNHKDYEGPLPNTNNTVRLHCVIKYTRMQQNKRQKVNLPLQNGVEWYGANSQNLNCNDQWQPFPVGQLNYRIRYRKDARDTSNIITQPDAHEMCIEMPPGHRNFKECITELQNKRQKIC